MERPRGCGVGSGWKVWAQERAQGGTLAQPGKVLAESRQKLRKENVSGHPECRISRTECRNVTN